MSRVNTKAPWVASRWALSFVLATLLAGCQLLGSPALTGFNEKLAGGYTAVAAARGSAVDLLRANAITVDDAKNVQAQADVARQGLDVAKSLQGTDFKAADQRLASTLKVVDALTAYLTLRQKETLR